MDGPHKQLLPLVKANCNCKSEGMSSGHPGDKGPWSKGPGAGTAIALGVIIAIAFPPLIIVPLAYGSWLFAREVIDQVRGR